MANIDIMDEGRRKIYVDETSDMNLKF